MQPIRHAADPRVPVASWVAGLLALMVGLTYAVVSGYWAVGGTVGLDTVGGVFEQAGRTGGPQIAIALWAVVAIKVVAALLPALAQLALPRPGWRRPVRRLAWIDAVILTAYGLVLTTTGLLVHADLIQASPNLMTRAGCPSAG